MITKDMLIADIVDKYPQVVQPLMLSGMGCIGCAISHELPAARLVMVDISDRALEVSKQNLRLNRRRRRKASLIESGKKTLGQIEISKTCCGHFVIPPRIARDFQRTAHREPPLAFHP